MGQDNSTDRLVPIDKSSVSGPPSLPSVLSGRIGIWRTVRGNRMFIELKGGAFRGITENAISNMSIPEKKLMFGKYFDENGRIRTDQSDFQQGEILDGPAEFVGKPITAVGSKDWEKLTPEKTKQEFSRVKVADKGLESLKSSIRRAINNPQDTRMKRLKGANTVDSLVPLARISGFTDAEIKKILTSGKPSDNVVESLTIGQEKPKAPTVTRLSPRGASSSAVEGALAVQIEESISEVDRAASLRPEALKSILEGLRDSREDEKFKTELDKLINRLKLSRPGKEVDDIANKAIALVEKEIDKETKVAHPEQQRLQPAKDESETSKPTDSRLKEDEKATKESAQSDKKAVQSAVDSLQTDADLDKLAKDYMDEADGDSERARLLAMGYILGQLESTVRLPQVKREVVKIREAVSSGKVSRSEILFLLIQILRLILTVLMPF